MKYSKTKEIFSFSISEYIQIVSVYKTNTSSKIGYIESYKECDYCLYMNSESTGTILETVELQHQY